MKTEAEIKKKLIELTKKIDETKDLKEYYSLRDKKLMLLWVLELWEKESEGK